MPVLKSSEASATQVKDGLRRTLIHGDHLMTAIIDFTNGPWEEPDRPHHHVHEQITYVVSGELIFFCEGEPEQRLKTGDMFYVPSGRSHTVQLLTKTVRLIDSFSPVREDFL